MIAGHTKLTLQNWPSLHTSHKSSVLIAIDSQNYSIIEKCFGSQFGIPSNIRRTYIQNSHDNSYRYLALLYRDTHAFYINPESLNAMIAIYKIVN